MTRLKVTPAERKAAAPMSWFWRSQMYFYVLAGFLLFSTVRIITGEHDLDSQGAIREMLLATCPILLAGLGGLWSERAGVVNIGLEGQMLLGTWGGAYFTYWYNPWIGLLGGIALGMLGGLLHALATVTFGVDHIVSGVALNVMALGLTTFLAEALFSTLNSEFGRGGAQQLTGLKQPPVIESIPGVTDSLSSLGDKHWWVISDLANILAALTSRISVITILVFVLVFATWWILWKTAFGLRLRSCGENPAAAESLGVNVILHKYAGVLVSGGLAGIGGYYLALVATSGFHTGQTGGRGYIGLAAMIFGNWRPGGTMAGSLMFGYADRIRFRDETTIHALLLFVGLALVAIALLRVVRKQIKGGLIMGAAAAAFLVWYFVTETVKPEFAGMTPYIATLLVLTFAAQSLRMPKADGQIYRKGSSG